MKHLSFAIAVILLLIPTMGFGQDRSTEDLMEMSLEDLLDMNVTVASKNAMSIRETPGIVSVITEKEIVSSGASDLMEVLRLVPGFEYGVDVSGVTGMTLRGNMGYIGRVLLMIDGQEVNELFYSCSFSDNHYAVDNVKRIEVIRGPGSAIYGGFAELGVINVITKNGADLDGFSATANAGQMSGNYSHRNVTVSYGKQINDNTMYSISGFFNQSNRSNRDILDFYGDSYDMTDNSGIRSLTLNANLAHDGLGVRMIFDDYLTSRRDQYDINMLNAYDTHYKQFLGEVAYEFQPADNVTVTPKYNAVYSVPWQSTEEMKTGDDDLYAKYDRRALRNKIGLNASIDFTDDLNVIAGTEFVHDNATEHLAGDVFWNGETSISYTNISGYFQGILRTELANVTLGARVDQHSQFGVGFAPRVGLTKAWDKLHMKFLLSQAFRAPSIDEIDYSTISAVTLEPDIEPEVAQVAEFEIGYRVAPGVAVNANAFISQIDNTILYTVVQGIEGYSNTSSSGTKGFEIECLVRKDWGFANLNYSFYTADGVNDVEYYKVIDETVSTNVTNLASNEIVGSSPHKIAFNSSFAVSPKVSLSPSFTYIGTKHAYTAGVAQVDSNGDLVTADGEEVWVTVPTEQDAIFLVNMFVNVNNLFQDGVNLAFGVHNVLDAEYNFSQPYNGWHGQMPGEGRRFGFKLSYGAGPSN